MRSNLVIVYLSYEWFLSHKHFSYKRFPVYFTLGDMGTTWFRFIWKSIWYGEACLCSGQRVVDFLWLARERRLHEIFLIFFFCSILVLCEKVGRVCTGLPFLGFRALVFEINLSGIWSGSRAVTSKEKWVNLTNGINIYLCHQSHDFNTSKYYFYFISDWKWDLSGYKSSVE